MDLVDRADREAVDQVVGPVLKGVCQWEGGWSWMASPTESLVRLGGARDRREPEDLSL
jgi:hypothetical protein